MIDTLSNYLGNLDQDTYTNGAEDAYLVIHTNDANENEALDAFSLIHEEIAKNNLVISSYLPAYPFRNSQQLPFEKRVNLIILNIRNIGFTKSILQPTANVTYGSEERVTIKFDDEIEPGGINATFYTEDGREIGHIEFNYSPEEKRLTITELQQRHSKMESEDCDLNSRLRKYSLVYRSEGKLANVKSTPVIEFNLLSLVKTLAEDYHLDLSGGCF